MLLVPIAKGSEESWDPTASLGAALELGPRPCSTQADTVVIPPLESCSPQLVRQLV